MNIFIDGGYHHGQGLVHFTQKLGIGEGWHVHCFEPNPACAHRLIDIAGRTNHQAAIWIEDGTLPFFQDVVHGSCRDGQGSSCIKNFTCDPEGMTFPPPNFEGAPVEVEAIDFVRFLSEFTTREDAVFIKLDTEGAEFAVLRHMLHNPPCFHNVRGMFIEPHERFMDDETKETRVALFDEVAQFTEVALHW